MARSYKQKASLLYLLDYLSDNTNSEKIVTNKDIIDYLKIEHNITIDRKTVYTDIGMLAEYGLNVEYDYKQKGYKVKKRKFDLTELQLIVDSVQSSKFITATKAKELTAKLKKLASRYDRSTFDRRFYVENRIHSMNDSIFADVDKIHKCIETDKQLSFRYLRYKLRSEKEYFKDIYIVNPYALLWSDNNYYLLAYHDKKMKHFRVDKMEKIKEIDEKREGKDEFKNMDLSERSTKLFSMFGGKEERITLRFTNNLKGVAIDRFGTDINPLAADKNHFTIRVGVEISDQFFGWLCGFGKSIKILSPDDVVKKMGDYVMKIAKMYGTDTEK